MTNTLRLSVLCLVVALAGCDKVPLLAPTGSSVTVNAATLVVPTGGTTEVTAAVIESAGTPVQNGTTVTFTTTLGTVMPATAQTQNGVARTTFNAGGASGVAEIRATSGAAAGSGETATNVVSISVGTAAATTVTLRATPGSVSPNGGTVEVVALVTGTGGRAITGVPVTFSADNGTLAASTATTDANGEARTTLTTDRATAVTASVAGLATAATTNVTARVGPILTFTCAIGTPAVAGCSTANVGQPVTFTASRDAAGANIRSATLDFGDGSSVELGTLSSSQTVNHSYSGAGTYTARLTVTDTAGETAVATLIVQVQTGVNVSVTAAETSTNNQVRAEATVSGGSGGPSVVSYQFEFGTGATPTSVTTTSNSATAQYSSNGLKTITVTVTMSDGRTVSNSTQITLD